MKFFVTGTSGFIGFHLARRLLSAGHSVTGYDGMTAYYDVSLKVRRRARLMDFPAFNSVEAMLEDRVALAEAVSRASAEIIIHLAAQTGVRYSLEHPQAYLEANLVGTFNLLEAARQTPPRHLLSASSSSIYGGNASTPFAENQRTDFPVSLYAATKKAGEAMAHSYAHIHGLPTTCLRFFTAYGPWGRPDMALFRFVRAIEQNETLDIYGHGQMRRDFTYIDDLVDGVLQLMDVPPQTGKSAAPTDSISPVAPWRAVNIGGGNPAELLDFVEAIERALGKSARRNLLPMQPGDVRETSADTKLLDALIGPRQATPLATGIAAFVEWYRAQ